MTRVGVVAVAQIQHSQALWQTVRGLVYQVSRAALTQANLPLERLDTIVTCSSDYWQGTGCSNVFYYEAAAAYLKDSPKTEGDSANAFAYACMRILSGLHRTALVVAVTKGSEAPPIASLSNLACDPFYLRPLAMEETAAAALQARLSLERYGMGPELLARVACRNLRNALYNPHAHRRGDFSQAEVMASPLVAEPLRALHCAPSSDGACAILLADEETARQLHPHPIWVLGFGWAAEGYGLGERDLLATTALERAAQEAYARAGIRDPGQELDVVELGAPYAHQEALWYEGLGLCPAGEGWRLIQEGVTEIEGPLPVNPSGGFLASNPYMARGLMRVAEASLQLWGRAGPHQVKGSPGRALAHSSYGLAGQAHTVIVLGRE